MAHFHSGYPSSFIEYLSKEILALYEEIDIRVDEFKERTGLRCKKDCGECCAKKNARITPLEFIPFALEIEKRGETSKYIEVLRKMEDELCIAFRPYTKDLNQGYCSIYPFRPATCRLYGFAFKRNKYGAYEPSMCDYLKETFKKLSISEISTIPFLDYDSVMIRLYSLYPSFAYVKYSANSALLRALEKVGLLSYLSFSSNNYKKNSNDEKYGKGEKNGVKR